MEADWEFEIGSGAPVMDASWSGYVDIGAHPELAAELPEAAQLPGLADALRVLNSSASPVWTSKCDSWCVDVSENPLDPIEMDAPEECTVSGHACYIDILARPPLHWLRPEDAAAFCMALCARLRSQSLPCSRADLIVRSAVAGTEESFGVTAYLTACGASDEAAKATLARALAVFADSVCAA